MLRIRFETEKGLLPYRWYPMARIQQDMGGHQLFETAFNFLHYHVYRKLQSIEQPSDIEIINWKRFRVIQTLLSSLTSISICLHRRFVSTSLRPERACRRASRPDQQLLPRTLEAMASIRLNAMNRFRCCRMRGRSGLSSIGTTTIRLCNRYCRAQYVRAGCGAHSRRSCHFK